MIFGVTYPDGETYKETILSSCLAGLLLYLLLIIYQPFGTSQFEHAYKYLLLFPYAIITTICICSINLTIGKRKKRTIGLELFKTFIILLSISSISYMYNTLFISKVDLSLENFLYMFSYVSALALPVFSIYILARYIYLNNKNKTLIDNNITSQQQESKNTFFVGIDEEHTKLYISADYMNFELEIEQKDFIYAEAADNYCIIYFYKNGMLKNEIIRISLTRLLNQIQTDVIKKVHRSFIVNLKKVSKFKGNTGGYKITIQNPNKELIVSRNYIDSVVPLLKNFANRP